MNHLTPYLRDRGSVPPTSVLYVDGMYPMQIALVKASLAPRDLGTLERLGISSYRNNVVILEDPLDLCLIVTPTKNPVPSSARYSTEPFRNFKIVPSALIIGCQH